MYFVNNVSDQASREIFTQQEWQSKQTYDTVCAGFVLRPV